MHVTNRGDNAQTALNDWRDIQSRLHRYLPNKYGIGWHKQAECLIECGADSGAGSRGILRLIILTINSVIFKNHKVIA